MSCTEMADLPAMGVFRHACDAQKHCQCRQLAVFWKLSHCVWLMNFRDCNWGPLQTVLAGGLEANSIFRDAYEIVCVCVCPVQWADSERGRGRDYILTASFALFSMFVLIQTQITFGSERKRAELTGKARSDASFIHWFFSNQCPY